MAKHGKNYRGAFDKVDKETTLTPQQGFEKVKEASFAKFDESVDVDVRLGIDPAKGDQVVRGSVVLPHNLGRKVRVIVFAKDKYIDQAVAAGADEVGSTDLIEKITGGWLDFDYAVSTPDMMGAVGKLAKVLGPKGLLPNKKLGTVTFDVGAIVSELKKGRSFFRNDKAGLVHFAIGKKSFEGSQLNENLQAFLKSLMVARPNTAKGKYIQKVSVSSTMGPGVRIDYEDLIK
ncbi:50S ribosomal protein L1 [bacterium]|jgi:large subunit ribosomal protein L1|nr:50S ribosomal protein L1 [bacterium]MBT5015145.1 50S ribosomal protein L1 [bacterium]